MWRTATALMGTLVAGTLTGCAHHEQAMNEPTTTAMSAQAESSQLDQQRVAGTDEQTNLREQSVNEHGLILHPKGQAQIPQGQYTARTGEYFQPQGIYGTKGQVEVQGQVIQKGDYGTYFRPTEKVQQPQAVNIQPQGTFYKPFGSNRMESERQPVAGHDTEQNGVLVRGPRGNIYLISNPEVVNRVQQKLSAAGCTGTPLASAVAQCQAKQGMQATGVLDSQTAQALGIDSRDLQQPVRREINPEQQPGGTTPTR